MTRYAGLMQTQPFKSFEHFRRMFDEFYAFGKMMSRHEGDVWMPPTDVYETDDELIIKVSLPGVKPRNIEIQFDGQLITICGFREWDETSRVVCYHQMEIRNGYFERKIAIHGGYDADHANAVYRDGFLKVAVPKAAKACERVVSIRLEP